MFKLLKEYSIILIILLAFIDYDIFVFFAICYFIYSIFSENKIIFDKFIKKLVYIEMFCFLILIRFLPIFNNKFLKIYNNISQQNYLSLDGKFYSENVFLDLQTFYFGLYCNNISQTHTGYITLFEGINLSCPFTSGYGFIFDILSIGINVWYLSVVTSFIALLILFLFYFKNAQNLNGKKFILLTLFFLSPPVNFLIFRLNIDLLIFLFLSFIVFNEKHKYLRNLILIILTFTKLYPIVFLLSFTMLDIIKAKSFIQPLNYISILVGSIYIYLHTIQKGTNPFSVDNQSFRSYGINNDSRYLEDIFKLPKIFFFVAILCLILIFSISFFKKIKFKREINYEIHSVVFFLGTGIFVNYDYKLIFLFFLAKKFIEIDNNFLNIVLFLFIYSSPSLLHAYEKYYKLIVNDEIFVLDFSFYILYSLCIAILIGYLKDIFINIK